ncbi:cell division cycle-associated 7-like protein isoform X2 [Callorhinchus milii]|uniref:Zinc-finger domain-containing protein n=1 Tax=Callorhinchus milii TaxID=7868 RepID=A0A4W3JMU7_CALMI|nr:cell division cycle-associated 7-like protein isoform X2 [Callorhinchus milii]|eukprot:gi/632937918/ref/XP_007901517.1/ PREDICTED: cell division cycle-associated 7-like protein isoform X2 [Callorhinchus milii]
MMLKIVADVFNTPSDDEFMGFEEADFGERCDHVDSKKSSQNIPKLFADIFSAQSDEEFMGFEEADFREECFAKLTPKLLVDVFNTPSDDEFMGFEEMDYGEKWDHVDSKKSSHVPSYQSKYITEELIDLFTDDNDSAESVFEGFAEWDVERNNEMECRSTQSEMEDEGFTEDDDGDDETDYEIEFSSDSEMDAIPKKSHFGLRVAFKFPTKRPVKAREPEPSESDSDEDSGSEKKTSNVLLKRALNIKENKEMLAKLMAELKTMPGLFPVKVSSTSPSKQRRTPKRTFSEGKIERRVNPTRSARPPQGFSVECFAISPTKLMDQVKNFNLRTNFSNHFVEGAGISKRRRRSSKYAPRPADDITDEDLDNVAITVRDKIYDRVMGNTCHQCRQKTIDTKTICRNEGCYGVRGQFCGPCLRNRYGEDVRTALLDADWVCPPCRGICNCSFCRRRDGRCATGILVHLAKFYGYDNVQAYLESLQKQLTDD